MLTIKQKIRRIPINGLLVALLFAVAGIALTLVSQADTPVNRAEAEDGVISGNASIVGNSAAAGGRSVQFGNSVEPYGLAAITNLKNLPMLQPTIKASGQSSYDRSGGNGDFNNFLGFYNGERLMGSMTGPGTVYRIWVTGFNANTDWMKVYFDGEATPRVNMKMIDLFSGTKAPFLSPLVVNNAVSSGGFVSYLPLPYAKSIKITTNMGSYYNIGYHTLPVNATVSTWTGREDSSAARALWNRTGSDPHNEAAATPSSGSVNLAQGASQTLLDATGPGEITSLRLKIPSLANSSTITDNGRAHKGSSTFVMNVNPDNTGVTLSRRTDLDVAYQNANVYIDGQLAGNWFDGGPETNRFYNSQFTIPPALTAGKSRVVVKVQFVSSSVDWNEFAYWAYSLTPNGISLSDTLDVGNTASEASHSYSVTGPTWLGSHNYTYNSADILNSLQLRIFWDDEQKPSVDAPLGMFFGIGRFGVFNSRSLVMGLDSSGTLYAYFPMPYGKHAVVQLLSMRSQTTPAISYEVKRQPLLSDMSRMAYFKTQLQTAAPEVRGQDIPLLDVTGQGKFIGVVASYTGSPNRYYLEGDERIYVDNDPTPAIYGTGTEDFFNGGWYFDHGAFTQPLAGNPANLGSSFSASTVAYRLLLHDAVPFNSRLRATIEHGAVNDTTDNAWMLTYYYHTAN